MQTIQLAPGDILDDKYRLEQELGRGGFSRVYKATQLGMDRPVALKLMTVDVPQRQDDDDDHHDVVEQLITRFEQEAKLISRLKSAATISVYDYGQTREGLFFMALEYVQGRTLGQLKAPDLPLSPTRLVRLLEQILTSLREAHALGVIHRDLKPANIMIYDHLDETDLVKVLDFGIAKIFDNKDGAAPMVDVTRQGVLVGTPRYMAPELINGKEIGPWTDLYAVGLMCVELLTGQRAIAGKGELELLAWQLGPEQVRLPAEVQVPRAMRRMVDRLCEKDLARRYRDAREVLKDLERWQDDTPDAEDTSRGMAAPAPLIAEATAPSASGGGKLAAIVAAVLALLVLGVVAFMAGQRGDDEVASAAQPADAPKERPAQAGVTSAAVITPAADKPAEKPAEKPEEKPEEKPVEAEMGLSGAPDMAPELGQDKPADTPAVAEAKPDKRGDKRGDKKPKDKVAEKPADKPADKPVEKPAEPEFKAPKLTIETEGKPKRVVETVEGPLL